MSELKAKKTSEKRDQKKAQDKQQDDKEWGTDQDDKKPKNKGRKRREHKKRDDSWKKDMVITLDTEEPEAIPEVKRPLLEDHKTAKDKVRAQIEDVKTKIVKAKEERSVWIKKQQAERAEARE